MHKERVNPFVPNKLVHQPEHIRDLYKYQETKYRIDQVSSLHEYHTRKREFLKTSVGKKFQEYKIEQFGQIHNLDLYYVDGEALMAGMKHGDIDFTMGGQGYRYLYVPANELWVDICYKANPWPTVWHEFTERPLMARGMKYADAHEIASNLEMVLREGNFFQLPVGTYRQSAPGMCGPGSMKIYTDFLELSSLRKPLSEAYIASKCAMNKRDGTNPENMVKGAKALGFEAYEKQNFTVEEVKQSLHQGFPIIANHQAEPAYGEGHYAVIMGYSKHDFIISDPSENEGYVITPIEEFMAKWYELEDKTTRQGIVLKLP